MRKPSFYLAGAYGRKEEIKKLAKHIEKLGGEVTSRWLDEHYKPSVTMGEIDDATLRNIAQYDLEDIRRAENFVFCTEPQDQQPPRGGRHVEFGYALALGKKIFLVGAKENIFHHLPEILTEETIDREAARGNEVRRA